VLQGEKYFPLKALNVLNAMLYTKTSSVATIEAHFVVYFETLYKVERTDSLYTWFPEDVSSSSLYIFMYS